MSSVPRKCINSSEICVFWGVTSKGMCFYPHVKGHVNVPFFYFQWRHVSFPPHVVLQWACFRPNLMHFDPFHFPFMSNVVISRGFSKFLWISPQVSKQSHLFLLFWLQEPELGKFLTAFIALSAVFELSNSSFQAQSNISTSQLLWVFPLAGTRAREILDSFYRAISRLRTLKRFVPSTK